MQMLIQSDMAYCMKAEGKLDGLTILRYAHAYESGGGVEQHLADLNRELSVRNRMTTIQMQLTIHPECCTETFEKIGNSVLIRVPLLVKHKQMTDRIGKDSRPYVIFEILKQQALNLFLSNDSLNHYAMKYLFRWRKVPRRQGEPDGVGTKVKEIVRRMKVDMIMLHSSGGADASEIIEFATAQKIPTAIIHHFSNDRLGGVSLRQQVSRVSGVAGASCVGIPYYLRKKFWNLSDAVDTDFYRRENVLTLCNPGDSPILYTPARITPDKGQADVIEVASILKRRGLKTRIVFAGRVDSLAFEAQLRRLAEKKGMSGAVEFLGPLSLEEYRNRYSSAHVTVMPTRHHEGMPRTLIDSQAMKVPPVVYDVGGTREGVKDKETGYIVRLGDIDGVANAVETLIRKPDVRSRMSEAGRKFVEEKFSLRAFAERHECFYSQVLETATSRLGR